MLTYRYGSSVGSSAMGMAKYYQSSEHVPEMMAGYYAGSNAEAQAVPRAELHPTVADGLGITAGKPLTVDELANLLAGKRADGEAIAGKAPTKNAFIDFTFSAPKSFSVALIHAAPEERALLEKAYTDAVASLMDVIRAKIGSASVGKTGGNFARNREPAEIAMIPIEHHTARPTLSVANGEDTDSIKMTIPGDPQRHTHIITLNAAFVAETGRVTSLYQDALQQSIIEWGAIGQALLATNLRKLGVNVELDKTPGLSFNDRMARLIDVPRWVCDLYSKRHARGEDTAREYAVKHGLDFDAMTPKQKAEAFGASIHKGRLSKQPGLNEYESWMQQAREANYKHRSVLRPGQDQELRPAAERHKQAYDVALPLINDQLERRAVLEGSVARVAAAKGLIETGIESADEVNTITAAMRSEGVQQDGKMTSLHWAIDPAKRYARVTTQLSVEMEQEAIGLLRAAAADHSVSLTPAQIERAVATVSARDGLDFTTEHGVKQRAFANMLGSSGRASCGVGIAGSGKSSTLRVLVEAWHSAGQETYGITLAWRQTQGLRDAGVGKRAKRRFEPDRDTLVAAGVDAERTFALNPFLKRVHDGRVKLTQKSTVIIDEVALVGTKQILELARLQAKHGFHIVAIGDDMQCQSIEAGSTINLARRAFGEGNVPELLSSVRQLTERERETAQMWREGNATEALARKDKDGTLHIVPGGYADAIKATVDLWSERTTENRNQPGFSLGISVPTNADGRAIGEAIRLRRRSAGEVGPDLLSLAACDQNGDTYTLAIAKGDRVRLFDRVRGHNSTGRVSIAGVNGTVVEVLSADRDGMDVRKPSGLVARIGWDALRKDNGPIRLTYGDAVTIDARQSDTVTEHITSMPSGSSAVNGFKAYTAESRHRVAAWLVTSQGAEKDQIQQRRPLGDPRNRETDAAEIKDAVLVNMARNMSEQPTKTLAVDFMDRAVGLRSGTVDAGMAGWHPRREAETEISAPVVGSDNPPTRGEVVPNTPTVIEQREDDRAVAAAIAAMDEDRAALLRVAAAVQDVMLVPPPTPEEAAIAEWAAQVSNGKMFYSHAIDGLLALYIENGGDIDMIDAVQERYELALSKAAETIDNGADQIAITRALRDLPRISQEQRDAARANAPTPVVNNNLLRQMDREQDRQIINNELEG